MNLGQGSITLFWLNTWFRQLSVSRNPLDLELDIPALNKDGQSHFQLVPPLSACSPFFTQHYMNKIIRNIEGSLTYIACGARRSAASAVLRVGIQNSAAAEDDEGTSRPIWRTWFQTSSWSSCGRCALLIACRPRVGDDHRGRCSYAAQLSVGGAAPANSPPEKLESNRTGNRNKQIIKSG